MAVIGTQQAAINAQIAEITAKINALTVGKPEQAVRHPIGVEDANYINGRNHGNFQQVQPGMHNRGQHYQQFQPGGRPHPNLSYGNLNNAVQPPPGFPASSGGVINEPKKANLEEMMQQMLAQMGQIGSKIANMENNFAALSKQVQMLETQVGQMANQAAAQHKPGQFPSNTTVNPKSHCNAILDEALSPEDEEAIEIFLASCEEMSKERESPIEEDDDDLEEIVADQPPTPNEQFLKPALTKEPAPVPIFPRPEYKPKVPFPGRLAKPKVSIDMSSSEVFHAKKNEEVVVHLEKRVIEKEKILPKQELCTELPMKLLPKKEDPGCFTIACKIGGELFPKALCDLGANVNVMPVSVFKRLGIGDLKPTSMEIQMADRSRVKPRGKLEDIFVKVDKLVFPTDFLVLDIPEDANPPLILGRSFLATGQAVIDVPNGSIVFRAADAHRASVSVCVGQSAAANGFDVH